MWTVCSDFSPSRRSPTRSHTRACCWQQRLPRWLLLPRPTCTSSVDYETTVVSSTSNWLVTGAQVDVGRLPRRPRRKPLAVVSHVTRRLLSRLAAPRSSLGRIQALEPAGHVGTMDAQRDRRVVCMPCRAPWRAKCTAMACRYSMGRFLSSHRQCCLAMMLCQLPEQGAATDRAD